MASTTPPTLKHVLNLSLIPTTVLDAGATPRGRISWVELPSGELTTPAGDKIATVLPGGGDYCTRHVDDLMLEVDLRVVAQTPADPATGASTLFKFQSVGYDKLIKPIMGALDGDAAAASAPPPPGEEMPSALYGTEVLWCNTSSKEYWWMNFAVLVAKAALVLGPKGVEKVEYAIYQVVV
ncbi:uncharacterized protein Z520_04050 [Fonsecaea multimorphosa CBS 102226]|uniref:Uncharacterized protein n=1 Tax=Fonsecaea multimorphosa CBS 102226 TaxID=1442371 RepID=A0A0D2KB47_9EURO|nr:uncharacterized protein Z520_04050 [Fonsecaea multimorphosa CBS 102226]KIY00365.1 hypothetical protein Z520_04050 [Fonsecaea multimorphosa CBS 102226]OAL27196.1 hypothetical protein AYO22_03827 [Fonsecaea multimorphosa]